MLLQGLSMRLDPGMSLLITGPSGAGKSSLMRAIAGEFSTAFSSLYMDAGTVDLQLLDGKSICGTGHLGHCRASHMCTCISIVHTHCLFRHLVQALHTACAAGLWTRGSGTVAAPAADKLFFLPQKPFMPLGTLRQQLLFPTGERSRESMRAFHRSQHICMIMCSSGGWSSPSC